MSRIALITAVAVSIAIPSGQAIAQPPVAERPTITIAAFDFGTVAQTIQGDPRTRRRFEAIGVYDGNAFAEGLGVGAADMLTEKLVNSQRFRVFERKQLDAVTREQRLDGQDSDTILRARYLVTGSVSHLGNNDKDAGGFLIGAASGILTRGAGMLQTSQSTTTVRLTARVVDTRTGEIIGSFTGEGESKKRWGVRMIGMGRGGFGGVNSSDKNFRETAIGEAMANAATAISEQVIALRATTLKP